MGEEEGVVDFGLGAEIEEIRQRVLGRRKGADDQDPLTAEDCQKVYEEIKDKVQVDLNCERNVTALEDPNLLAHMEAGRRRLAEQEKKILSLPKRATLKIAYLKVLGQMSELIRQYDETAPQTQAKVETAHLVPQALASMANGEKPRGYIAQKAGSGADSTKVLKAAAEMAKNSAEDFEGVIKAMDARQKEIFRLRREIETFADGMTALFDAVDEERRRLREYLQIALQGAAKPVVADPPETLGERLVLSQDLPEDSGIVDEAHPADA